jgi:asparagine N-glycosylation enzyme membrane subunit Stt3
MFDLRDADYGKLNGFFPGDFRMYRIAALIAVLLLVALARLSTFTAVFSGNDVTPYDTDPYYRLRQVQLIAHHFPQSPPVDMYSLGVDPPKDRLLSNSEPLLHPSMFIMAWAFSGGKMDDASLRKAAMFTPIFWALIASILAYIVARVLAGGFAGIISAIFAGFCMPVLWRTSLGALDNHMVECGVFPAMLLVSVILESVSEDKLRRWRVALLLGAWIGIWALLSYWTALATGLLCVTYGLCLVFFPNDVDSKRSGLQLRLAVLAAGTGLAGVINLAFWNLVSGAFLLTLSGGLFAQRFIWRRFKRRPLAIWCALLGGAFTAFCLAAPELTRTIFHTLSVVLHLSKHPSMAEVFYSTIGETASIPWLQLHGRFSLFIWVTPVLLPLLGYQAFKERNPTKAAICVMFLTMFFPSERNMRFSHMAASAMAPLIGLSLAHIPRFIEGRGEPSFWRRSAGYASKTIIALAMIVGFAPYVQGNMHHRLKNPGITIPMNETYSWLKNNTPECPDFWNPVSPPPYRIMSAWDYGWAMLDHAQRVPVSNNAAKGVRAELDYFFEATPEEGLNLLEQQNARYVMTTPTKGKATSAFRMLDILPRNVWNEKEKPENEKLITKQYLSTLHAALYVYNGSLREGPTGELPALDHYRQVFESKDIANPPDKTLGELPASKLFEVVEGAVAEGKAQPGAIVVATIKVTSAAGRTFSYSTKTTANEAGEFRLILPYPTDAPSGSSDPQGKWTISSGEKNVDFTVPSEAVAKGDHLTVDDLS